MKKIQLRKIAEGEFTYGERLELARILRDESMSEYSKAREIILCLHDIDMQPRELAELTPYIDKIVRDFGEWLEREHKAFYIPPTNEEKDAGIETLSKECGEMGNVVSLAEELHTTFEEVYKMPYLEYFARQKVHTERAKYERRLNKVYANKRK